MVVGNCDCGFVDCRPYRGNPVMSCGVTPPRTLSPVGNPPLPNSSCIDGPPTCAGVRSMPSRVTANRYSTTSDDDFSHVSPIVPAWLYVSKLPRLLPPAGPAITAGA